MLNSEYQNQKKCNLIKENTRKSLVKNQTEKETLKFSLNILVFNSCSRIGYIISHIILNQIRKRKF